MGRICAKLLLINNNFKEKKIVCISTCEVERTIKKKYFPYVDLFT